MRGKLMFVAGVAVGFVLGSRAGRERYDELSAAAQKILASPSLQEAGGVAKAQATKLYEGGKGALTNSKLAAKMRPGSDNGHLADIEDRDAPTQQSVPTT